MTAALVVIRNCCYPPVQSKWLLWVMTAHCMLPHMLAFLLLESRVAVCSLSQGPRLTIYAENSVASACRRSNKPGTITPPAWSQR